MSERTEFGIADFNTVIIKDFFRTYLFKVIIDTNFVCQWIANTSTPIVNTSVQNIDYMHSQVKQSGRTIPQQWQITVRDDADGAAFKYFNDWRRIIYPNPDRNTSPTRYKRAINLQLISPKITTPTRIYKMNGCWPMEIGNIMLDYESDNINTFPVTMSFDYYTITGAGE